MKRNFKPRSVKTSVPKITEEFFLSFFKTRKPLSFSLKIFIFMGGLALGYLSREKLFPDLPPQALPLEQAQVCFTPGQLCLPIIQQALAKAKKTIHLQAYSFTQPLIAQDLVKAAQRGVDITVILDKSQRTARSGQFNLLKGTSIKVFFDDKPAIAHNKIIIVDGKTLITGSYNFTQAAEKKNAENLLLIHSPKLAESYKQNFQKRLRLSSKA